MDFIFPLKNFIVNHLFFFLVSTFFINTILFASILNITERPFQIAINGPIQTWENMIWAIATSLTTIGYGDIIVQTIGSRVVVMVLVVWGNFWFSILMGCIFPYLQKNIQEVKTINLMNRIKFKRKIQESGFELIALQFKKKRLSGNLKEVIKIDELINYKKIQRKFYKKKLKELRTQGQMFRQDLLLRFDVLNEILIDQQSKTKRIIKEIN